LDELSAEDSSERPVRLGLQVADGISLLDVEALALREGDHVRVGVDATRVDARLAEQPEQLPAAAAEVEHGRRVPQVLDVHALAPADGRGRAAHPGLEGEVVANRGSRRLRGDRLRQGRVNAAGAAPLDAGHSLLQLAERPRYRLFPP